MISIIVAYDKNLAIGKDNQLVWKQSNDLKRFKELTTGKTIVMGRKTFESIGKPLPDRKNIVLSRKKIEIPGVEVIDDIDRISDSDYIVIGGSEIYKLFINKVDTIFATEIDCEIDADSWFPSINKQDWNIVFKQKHLKDEKNQYDYEFINFVRKNL